MLIADDPFALSPFGKDWASPVILWFGEASVPLAWDRICRTVHNDRIPLNTAASDDCILDTVIIIYRANFAVA